MGTFLTFSFLLLSCGVCFSSSSALPQLIGGGDHQSCSLCHHVVEKASSSLKPGSALSDISDQELVLISMVSSCESLADPNDRQRCTQFVETFGVAVVDYILNGQKQERVCGLLGVCGGDSQPDQAYETNIVEGLNPFESRLPTLKADARCELCKFFVELIDKTLDDQKNVQTVNATLMGICNSLKDIPLKLLCLTLEPQIITMIAQGLDPTTSCQASNFCPAQTKSLTDVSDIPGLTCEVCNILLENMAILSNSLSEELNGFCWSVRLCEEDGMTPLEQQPNNIEETLECKLCEFLVNEADGYLKNNKSEAAVNTTIYKLCNELPATFKPICLAYAPQIIAALAKGLDPQKVCIEVKLCTGNNTTVQALNSKDNHPSKVKATLECELCEFLVNTADQYLKDNKSEAAINSTIYKLCNELPASFKPICVAYAPQIIAALAKGLDTQKVCVEVKLCKGNGTNTNFLEKLHPKSVVESSTVECELCEFIINQADSYLKNKNFTPAQVNNTVYGLCNDLPVSFRPFCDYYADKIVSFLIAGVDPGQICTELKLCSGNSISQQTSTQFEKKPSKPVRKVGSFECDMCEFIVANADAFLHNKTPAAINNTVYGYCNLLPSLLQSFCDSYAPKIVAVLVSGVDPEKACTEIKLCTGNSTSRQTSAQFEKKPSKPVRTSKVGSFECDLCEFIVNNADAVLHNKTPSAINNTVYGLCNDLPSLLQTFCDSYAAKIVAVLVSGVDPEKACTAIKLCTADRITERESFEKTRRTSGKPKDKSKVEGLECEICKFIVNKADDYIKNKNFTPAEVNKTVFGICNELPASFRDFCYTYAPKIVMALVSGVDPAKACTEIKLCTSVAVGEKSSNLDVHVQGLECEICKFIVNKADDYIKNKNFTPAEVNKTVFGICNDLPASFRDFCYTYAPKIVMALVSGVDPAKACTEIKLCTSVAVGEKSSNLDVHVEGLECEICKFIVNKADDYIKNKNFTPAEVNKTVFGICNDLPASFRDFCYTYAPKIVMALVSGVDPAKACTEIKLCTSVAIGEKSSNLKVHVEGVECEICKFIVNKADDYIKNKNFTPAEVNKTVFGICNDLPASFRDFCYTYAPKIVMALVSGVDPVKACTEIKLCTSVAVGEKSSNLDRSFECLLCELIVKELDYALTGKNQTRKELNRTVFSLCDQLPHSYQKFCYSEAPSIVDFLYNGASPKAICLKLKVCVAERKLTYFQNLVKLGSIECEACKVLFATLDDDLYKDETKVQGLLNEVCHQLPPPTDKKCLGFVTDNFDDLWEKFLSKVLSPDGVCKLLKLCK